MMPMIPIEVEEKYVSDGEAEVVQSVAHISGKSSREIENFIERLNQIRNRSERKAKVQEFFRYLEPRVRGRREFLNERMEEERNAPPLEPGVKASFFVPRKAAWERESDDPLSHSMQVMLGLPTLTEELFRMLETYLDDRNRLESRKLHQEQMVRAKRAELACLMGERNG
jgi:hypothetical protein